MCLISYELSKISDKQIKVYKIVERKADGLYAPFQRGKYVDFPIMDLVSKFPPIPVRECQDKRIEYNYGLGFIHAFVTKECAMQERERLHSLPGSRMFEVYEGYIPENIEYAISTDEKTICARKIILEKKI